jgi:L,D-transpeptidase catalytic domain
MRRVALALAVVAACGGKHEPERARAADAAPATVAPAPSEPPGPPGFPSDVLSLRLKRSIVVRFGPDENAKPIGTIAQDTRVKWKRVAFGPGCARWVEIEPRGWICDRYLEASKKPPAGVELPKLKPDELVPGTYARVIAGGASAYKSVDDVRKGKPARRLLAAMKVRKVADEVIAGRLYWKTTGGEYIEYAKLTLLEPSTFVGVRLGDEGVPPLPLGWAQGRRDMGVYVKVYRAPKGQFMRSLKPRTVVQILESSEDGLWQHIRTGELDGWMASDDLHVARVTAPPPFTGASEKWFDVDLDEQVVVAYEGEKPVYATLTASGSKKWPTVPGIYRIWIKFAETDMNGQMGDEDPYSVATVPWTMFFARDLAFHTAYWHDKFGEARSHGCLNLSPRDARALYFWATPEVPPGWSMAYGIVEDPGATVRIRSKLVPLPPWQGYAKRVFEARLVKAGGVIPGLADAGVPDAPLLPPLDAGP